MKFELVFVLTQENASKRFHFKSNRKSAGSSKNHDFQNSPPFERSACFHVTITGNLERFQNFRFGLSPSKKKILFASMKICFLFHVQSSFGSRDI